MAPSIPVSEFTFQLACVAHCFKGSSDRERLSSHSKVLALQQRLTYCIKMLHIDYILL